jgi:HEAT repeat protein
MQGDYGDKKYREDFLKEHRSWLEKATSSARENVAVPGKGAQKLPPSAASEARDGPNELGELETILTAHEDPDERASAAFFLGSSDEREAIPILERGLSDPDAEVRLAVVESLGDLAEYLSPQTLAPVLNDADPEVRIEAVTVLSDIETPEACQLIKLALNDSNEEVRLTAEGLCD